MSESNLGSDGLPTTIPFEKAFLGVSLTIITERHNILDQIEDSAKEEWDTLFDPEDVRWELSFAIDNTLAALGVPQPKGSSLDWLGGLHDLLLKDRPGLTKYLEVTTDRGGEG